MGTPDAGPSDRQPTQSELEQQEGRRQAERRAARIGSSPKPNGATAGSPSPSPGGATVDTGIATARLSLQPCNPPDQRGSEVVRSKQDRTTRPNFDHATALKFYNAIRPSAFIVGYKQGRSASTREQFQVLAQEADCRHEHLFFAVATLKPEWADPHTHEKGRVTTPSKDRAVHMPDGSASHVLECPYLWGDCDAAKYEGNNPDEAKAHYELEGVRVVQQVDQGLEQLGITPFAKWRSGAGWQFLIKLDQAVEPSEAETLVAKLHTALGFDPVVRNCNRILRVPGSVNWKQGKDGRVPSPCSSLSLVGAVVNVDDVREALADIPEPDQSVRASEVTEINIDWSKVLEAGGWLQSESDLPAGASPKLRAIVGHSGRLPELNNHLIGAKLLEKPYASWSEVTLALAASLRGAGYTPEQAAEVLLADLPCNQHIAKQQDKKRAVERAISRSHTHAQVMTAGAAFRDRDRYGKAKPSLANAVIALRALGIEARYDLFHHRIKVTYKGQAHTIREGLLTDDKVSAARSLINNTYEIDCGDANTLAAIREIAFENAFDPVLDMLEDCQGKWDGKNRLDTWVIDYLGCEDTPLNRAIGRKVLIAACRRAREPGCKFDNITVEEGVEGINKSTAIRVLAGDDNFSDQSILGASDKEVQEQLEGVWMHENADLAGMRRADVEHIKAFASRQVDRARPAYGRVREDRPRRSIEWGTTNDDKYLLSQTGNRRIWPLKTDNIDVEALKRDREQLLGEAATNEAAGESITLDPRLWGDARDAQEKRRVTDPWEDLLTDMPDHLVHRSGDGYERVASADVLTHVLQIPRAQQTSAHGQRLARAMQHAGWERNDSCRVTIKGETVRGYIRREVGPTGPSGATGTAMTSVSGPTGPTGGRGAHDVARTHDVIGPTGATDGVPSSMLMPTGIAFADGAHAGGPCGLA